MKCTGDTVQRITHAEKMIRAAVTHTEHAELKRSQDFHGAYWSRNPPAAMGRMRLNFVLLHSQCHLVKLNNVAHLGGANGLEID